MKLSKLLSRSAKLRNLSVLFVLMLSIAFLIYNLGTAVNHLKILVTTITTNMSVESSSSINSFWDDSIKLEANIPADVVTLAEKLLISDKTISVDVSTICFYVRIRREYTCYSVSRP